MFFNQTLKKKYLIVQRFNKKGHGLDVYLMLFSLKNGCYLQMQIKLCGKPQLQHVSFYSEKKHKWISFATKRLPRLRLCFLKFRAIISLRFFKLISGYFPLPLPVVFIGLFPLPLPVVFIGYLPLCSNSVSDKQYLSKPQISGYLTTNVGLD